MAVVRADLLDRIMGKLDDVLAGQQRLEERMAVLEQRYAERNRQLAREETEYNRQVMEMYFAENNISDNIANKAREEFEKRPTPALKLDDVTAFKHMNINTVNDVLIELRRKTLSIFPAFQQLQKRGAGEFVDKLSTSRSTRNVSLRKGDVLMEPYVYGVGARPSICAPECMAFIVSGSLNVLGDSDEFVKTLERGSWVSEPSLWCEDWRRTTRIVANEESEVLLISGVTVSELYLRLPDECQGFISNYAVNFMEVQLVHIKQNAEMPMEADLHKSVVAGKIKSGEKKPTALKMLREVWRAPSFETQLVQNSFFSSLRGLRG